MRRPKHRLCLHEDEIGQILAAPVWRISWPHGLAPRDARPDRHVHSTRGGHRNIGARGGGSLVHPVGGHVAPARATCANAGNAHLRRNRFRPIPALRRARRARVQLRIGNDSAPARFRISPSIKAGPYSGCACATAVQTPLGSAAKRERACPNTSARGAGCHLILVPGIRRRGHALKIIDLCAHRPAAREFLDLNPPPRSPKCLGR